MKCVNAQMLRLLRSDSDYTAYCLPVSIMQRNVMRDSVFKSRISLTVPHKY